MRITEINELLKQGQLDEKLRMLTCSKDIEKEVKRYQGLLTEALNLYGDQEAFVISSPGRTEVGGNHTDHQGGCVLAASVNMDIVAVVIKDEKSCQYTSDEFKVKEILVDDLDRKESEQFTSEALIRGTLAGFKKRGYAIGGFKALTQSDVLPGSGISSSAAFEVLIGTILSELYNDGKVDPVEIAKIGQEAENQYFMKPCGLLDQMACSVGGFVFMDFKDSKNPKVQKVDFDFAQSDIALCLVDTKGSHADLSQEYGFLPQEMKEIAKAMGKSLLSECERAEFYQQLSTIRNQCSDRSLLRAMHYFDETERASKERDALQNKNLDLFKKLVIESGYSSYMYLQNVNLAQETKQQSLALTLAISEQLLKGKGAYRVHGGGFAGTIQAFVPKDQLSEYKRLIEEIHGEGSCFVLSVRPVGGYRLI